MLMLPLLVAALLGASALFIVMAPLFVAERAAHARAATDSGALVEREALAKQALREVEFDHQLGNLADDDYRTLRERYMRRALAAMKGRYDRERAVDDFIESHVRALRGDPAVTVSEPRGGNTARSSPGTPPSVDRRTPSGTGTQRRRSGTATRRKGRAR